MQQLSFPIIAELGGHDSFDVFRFICYYQTHAHHLHFECTAVLVRKQASPIVERVTTESAECLPGKIDAQ